VGLTAFKTVRQAMVAFAALLMAVLSVQAPAEQAHLDADVVQATSALNQAAEPPGAAAQDASTSLRQSAVQPPTDPHASEAPASGAHHHHADGPPLHDQAADADAPAVATTAAARFRLDNDHRAGLTGNPQDRPPRSDLEPIA
jgi:hypothetical protein